MILWNDYLLLIFVRRKIESWFEKNFQCKENKYLQTVRSAKLQNYVTKQLQNYVTNQKIIKNQIKLKNILKTRITTAVDPRHLKVKE